MQSEGSKSLGDRLSVDRDQIRNANLRISGKVRSTPVIGLEEGFLNSRGRITLKLEHLQHTGSFKPRGATNRLLYREVGKSGAIAASGGNHGAAVAYAARALRVKAEIFVPEISSPVKLQRLREYGATLNVTGSNYAEALAASRERAEQSGALVVHAYDQPEIVAGQGTVAMELQRQAPELDTVLVAVGGGGLIGGMSAWYSGTTRVVGVEPESAPSMSQALTSGGPVEVQTGGLAADSLGARSVGEIAYSLAERYVDSLVLVGEESIRRAQRLLWDELRLAVEPAGAVAPAALLSGAYGPEPGEKVGVVLCGGNVDPATLAGDQE